MKNYLLCTVCITLFIFSCKQKRQAATNTTEPKKALGKLNTDSTAPPIVIPYVGTPVKLSPIITSKPASLNENLGKEVITTLSSETGLPLGDYRDVLQDEQGNLWMNTGNEIVKYDGNSFHAYKLGSSQSFIMQVFIDKKNNICVAVIDFSSAISTLSNAFRFILYYFDGYSFRPLPGLQLELSGNNVSFAINQGPDKKIWLADKKNEKILVYDGLQLLKTIDVKQNSFKNINEFSFGDNNTIWIADRGDTSVTRYDGSQFKKYTTKDGLPEASLRNTIPLTDDSLLINTNKGLYLFQNRKATKIIDSTYSGIFVDKESGVWVRQANGNVVKHSSSGNLVFGKEDGIDGPNRFNSDNQGNIWNGAENKLFRFYQPIVKFRDIFPNNKEETVYPYIHDKKDNYWFGSWESGIYRYDGKLMTNYSFLNKSAGNNNPEFGINDITEDKSNNIWINTGIGGIIQFDGQSFFNYNNLGSSVFPIKARKLFIDSKNNIWFSISNGNDFISTFGAGYFNGKETVCYGTAQGLPHKFVSCIYEDRKGIIWFGSYNGLSSFDGKRFTNYGEKDGLPNNYVFCIIEDEFGKLWIGTKDGLSRFDGEKFVNYSKDEGISSGHISSIQKSPDKDHLWLETSAGITAMHLHSADSVSFENLDELNGFPVKTSGFLVDKDGALWASDDRKSLKRVDYNKVVANAKPFYIHLSNIRVNNSSLCWNILLPDGKTDSLALQTELQHRFGKTLQSADLLEMKTQFGKIKFDSLTPFDLIPANLVLPYSTNAVSFEFAAIDPHFSKYTRYQYMLEGFDKSWSPLSKNNSANFGKLSEGNYTFRVKALNLYGRWSEMSYSFKVLPPWSRTWWAYSLYAFLFISGIVLFIRWRTKTLKAEKIKLEEKVTSRTAQLNQSLEELKSTQSQLIQSEKMASLGELTAGIAHEIQNPLNFINNFSEVNKELLEEMNEEIQKRNYDEAKAIAQDIVDNEDKIIFHGKRADNIVKGMLQHSRSNSGQRELCDINALCDEYLRLAYHGLRAKDKSFNASMKTDFDKSIGNITIVAQDIGRVVLNLINNAFYVVDEKKRQVGDGYEPTVSVSTKRSNDKVEIKVADNGNGIPQKVLDKIFQPFFTTKPTGQGTGLGLSLSYDIVKAHGGEIKVNTKTNEGTEFVIHLPIN